MTAPDQIDNTPAFPLPNRGRPYWPATCEREMKVNELQKNLAALDPELEVLCYCEDEEFQGKGTYFAVFDILSVNEKEATRTRLDDGTPYLILEQGSASEKLAILQVTSDT